MKCSMQNPPTASRKQKKPFFLRVVKSTAAGSTTSRTSRIIPAGVAVSFRVQYASTSRQDWAVNSSISQNPGRRILSLILVNVLISFPREWKWRLLIEDAI